MGVRKVIILGGGLSGLSTALALSKSNHDLDIKILEKSDHVGGLASSFKHRGEEIPVFYHHIFRHDDVTLRYLKRFGILRDMVWKRIKMAIMAKGKVYNFTDPFSLLKFDYLSFWGRIRYGLFGAYVFTLMNPDRIPDDLDAENWLMRFAGKEVTKKLFENLYARNKFNIPLAKISAKQFAHRLKAKEAVGFFGYPKKGLQMMIDCFERELNKKNVRVLKKCMVKSIDLGNKVISYGKTKEQFDILINTIPIPEFLNIEEGLSSDEVDRLKKIRYCPAVSLVVGFKELLSDHYWLNVFHEPFHMIIQHSWLYDNYKDKVCWLGRYGGSEEDLPLSDKQIIEKYMPPIQKYFPKAKSVWTKVFREKYAEPIYDKDYAKYKPNYHSGIKGVYHAGVAVSYPLIRNMNTALISGEQVASLILEELNDLG